MDESSEIARAISLLGQIVELLESIDNKLDDLDGRRSPAPDEDESGPREIPEQAPE